MKYKFFCDRGHGWLRVLNEELDRLGIQDKITACSYLKGRFAYLEEDLDMATFLKARFGTDDILSDAQRLNEFRNSMTIHYSERSRIRTYQRYQAQGVRG